MSAIVMKQGKTATETIEESSALVLTARKGTGPLLLEIHTTLEDLTSSPHAHDAIELVLATAASLSLIRKEQPMLTWLLIVGNPSSFKTAGVLPLRGLDIAYFLDNLTENSFLSGYVSDEDRKNGKGKNGPKPQLLHELDGKVLVIKDLTTLFSGKDEKVKKILGELQSIFDGCYRKATGTVGVLEADSLFNLVACITPTAIKQHQRYMSEIGSRFLMFRLPALTSPQREEGFERVWDEEQQETRWGSLKQLVSTLFTELKDTPPSLEPETPNQRSELNDLSLLLARGRGVLVTERVTDINEADRESASYCIVDTQIEEPFRALYQLRTLARGLALIHGRNHVTDHELELLRRVVFSTIEPNRAKLLGLFSAHQRVTRELCAEALDRSPTRIVQLLEALEKLDLVVQEKQGTKMTYLPNPELENILRRPVIAVDHGVDLMGATSLTQNSPHTNLN